MLVSLGSCDGFGSLLGTHPGDDTESDLVDHVSDVVEDGHDFCIDSVGQNVSGWVEQVAERVNDPANADEPAQSVGAQKGFWGDLAVVDTLTGGPGVPVATMIIAQPTPPRMSPARPWMAPDSPR